MTPEAIVLPEPPPVPLCSEQKTFTVIKAVNERMENSKAKFVFLKWHETPDDKSRNTLREFVGELTVKPLLVEFDRDRGSGPETEALRQLVDGLWTQDPKDKARAEVIRALDRLPYSEALADAVFNRIPDSAANKHLVIAMGRAGQASDDLMSRVLAHMRDLKTVKRVLVIAQQPPLASGMEALRFQPKTLYNEIAKYLPEALQQSGIPGTGFYRRFRSYLTDATPMQGELAASYSLYADYEWAKLAARLAAPNWHTVQSIGTYWNKLEGCLEQHLKEAATWGELRPDNEEERIAFEFRMRFIAILYVMHPEAFDSAVNDADGADQFYRLQLILLGETAKDWLLSSALLPEWQRRLEDPSFRELIQSCFSWTDDEFSLVPRFYSSTQLQNELRWFSSRVLQSGSQAAAIQKVGSLQLLLDGHHEWLALIASGLSNSSTLLPNTEAIESAATALLDDHPSSADALRAAQILLSVDGFEEGLKHKELISDLIEAGISASRGGIRFDASLAHARALSIEGKSDIALTLLRLTKRQANNELWRAAVDIEIGYALERMGDYFQAVRLYQHVLHIGESLGADELVARAANGCLRCDAQAFVTHDETRKMLRARSMLQIQAARAPALFPLTSRDKPKIFLSYRSTTRAVVEKLLDALEAGRRFTPFMDHKMSTDFDFSPTIHKELLDSDAIVLILSPEFFNSPWCIHELHFALGQHDVRGISLFWAWCGDEVAADSMRSDKAVRRWIESNFPTTGLQENGYQRAHLDDRINRLFENGARLAEKPIVHRSNTPFDSDAAQVLAKPIFDKAHQLYKRARLTPTPDSPIVSA